MESNKKELNSVRTNLFGDNYLKYWHKDLPVIPDKYGSKMPAIKAWSDYCYRVPTKEECESWKNNFAESNIALCLGEQSGIVALDIDADDEKILDIIMPILPESPVVKKGSKGETRFFRYVKGMNTDILKFNGNVVVEILSSGKKTTIPPSLHPNGSSYKWTSEKTLLDIDVESLPLLPPMLFAHIESKLKLAFPNVSNSSHNKLINGRHDALISLCGKLIGENKTVDECIMELIAFDEKEHEVPYFTDPEEQRNTDKITNALGMYSDMLRSINNKRFRESKEYQVPIMQTVSDIEKIKEVSLGKLQKQVVEKKPKGELPRAHGVLGSIYSTILSNSWVKQEELAFGASLALMSTLVSRKVVFQGMSPNLYVLNVAPSGSGKDAPQQLVKNMLMDINAESLLGSGDYVSDASLMDSLGVQPVRLDIMDECGGILKTVTRGKSEYNGKMGDILAELWSASNSKYLGRATADGNKGGCHRPNVNLLCSTTPTGFSEGVSIQSIEKGLMGRFLIFQGDAKKRAERLTEFPRLDMKAVNALRFWFSFTPEDYPEHKGRNFISGVPQSYIELKATDDANKRLDEIFYEFDSWRIDADSNDVKLPIIARLYQQLVKITILHACSRTFNTVPEIITEDVNFAHKVVNFYYNGIEEIIRRYIFGNKQEKDMVMILNAIRDNGGIISKRELFNATRTLEKRVRDSIVKDLIESSTLIQDAQLRGKRREVVYYLAEEE